MKRARSSRSGLTFLVCVFANVDDLDEVVDVFLLLLYMVRAHRCPPRLVIAVLGRFEARHSLVPEDPFAARLGCNTRGAQSARPETIQI